jgi:hypothetical protein
LLLARRGASLPRRSTCAQSFGHWP